MGSRISKHDSISIGDFLDTSYPKNHFVLSEGAVGHLLIAGGIGITPLLSMARILAASNTEFELHYSARTLAAMPFRCDVESICRHRAGLYFTNGTPARRIRLGELLGRPRKGWHVYVCGPSGMIDDVYSINRHAGWAEETVHSESFSPPLKQPEDQPIEVVLARSGRTVIVPPDQTILDALLDVGIDVDHDCKRGECGTCRTTVLEGEPLHRDYCLSRKEQQTNQVIQICVSWAKSRRLVLDI